MIRYTYDPHLPSGANSDIIEAQIGQTTVDDFISTRHRWDMMIYKIFRSNEWHVLKAKGDTAGAPIDLVDGYIHFSTAIQAQETADKHFTAMEGLHLAAVDGTALQGNLKWEVSRGGAEFPHLYRRLQLNEVVWCLPLPLIDGRHKFPDHMI